MRKILSLSLILVILLSLPFQAYAEVNLNDMADHVFIDFPPHGFIFWTSGNISINPEEVIEGKRSYVGINHGEDIYTPFLATDADVIHLQPNKTYTLSFKYRILEEPNKGFTVLFMSHKGAAVNDWLPNKYFSGKAGDTGEISQAVTLGSYDDYQPLWSIVGTGAVAIDSILLTEKGSSVPVASTDFEEPPVSQGLLPFKITDTKTYALGTQDQSYVLRSAKVDDINGDGLVEAAIATTTYFDWYPQPVHIFGAESGVTDLTKNFYPQGAPAMRNPQTILFPDVNGDGRTDIIFSDCGLDEPPWTGSRMAITMQNSDGTFTDVSDKIPEFLWTTRSYAAAVGDLNGDGKNEVLFPDQSDGSRTAALTWENGGFSVDRNWVPQEIWSWPESLCAHSSLEIADLDGDGRKDLIIGGASYRPNLRILFGSPRGLNAKNLVTLPDGVFGNTGDWNWKQSSYAVGADANSLLVEDFDNDGLKDIFTISEKIENYAPHTITDTLEPSYEKIYNEGGSFGSDTALQVFKNQGERKFIDITPKNAGVLGRNYFFTVTPIDLNMDGFLDVVGGYWTKDYGSQKGLRYGSTVFLNDGTGVFNIIEGTELFPTQDYYGSVEQFGIFLPTKVMSDKIEGMFVNVKSDYHTGSMTVRKGVFEGALGKGSELTVIPKNASAVPMQMQTQH